jgi:hypothetical protein
MQPAPNTHTTRRRAALLLALALAALTAAAAPPKSQRDWKTDPAIAVLPAPTTLYAIGDIHGDVDKAAHLFIAAKLLKEIPPTWYAARWIGGTSVLVCTGDMIDKGPDSLAVLRLMRALQSSAAKSGGAVVVTLGNHEAEFLAAGGANKKAAEFASELQKRNINPQAFAQGRDPEGLGAWLAGRPVGAKVGDWFFSHAGNTRCMTIAQLESAVESGVDKQGFGAPILSDPNSLLEARMYPVPWWSDEFALNSEVKENRRTLGSAATGEGLWLDRLRDYAAALGCRHLVAGHQPKKVSFGNGNTRPSEQIYAFAGTFFLIDIGLSRGVSNTPAALLKITTGTSNGEPNAHHESASILNDAGQETPLWKDP